MISTLYLMISLPLNFAFLCSLTQKKIQATRENPDIVVSLFLLIYSLLAYSLLTAFALTKLKFLLQSVKHSTVLNGSLIPFILLRRSLKYLEVWKGDLKWLSLSALFPWEFTSGGRGPTTLILKAQFLIFSTWVYLGT